MNKKVTRKEIDFESNLEQLSSIVSKLESQQLSLEEALKTFEQGVKLSRDCQVALDNAEQKVTELSKKLEDQA